MISGLHIGVTHDSRTRAEAALADFKRVSPFMCASFRRKEEQSEGSESASAKPAVLSAYHLDVLLLYDLIRSSALRHITFRSTIVYLLTDARNKSFFRGKQIVPEVIPVVERPIEFLRVGLFEYLSRSSGTRFRIRQHTIICSHHGRGETNNSRQRNPACGDERCCNTDVFA